MIAQLLNGTRILVCRPEPSASELQQTLEEVGARVTKLPCIEIKPSDLAAEDKTRFMNLDQYQHVVVLSQHAARLGLDYIDAYWPQLPVSQIWHAIGQKTTQILKEYGVSLAPLETDLTSETLLEQPQLSDLAGQKVLVLSGHGGRKLIHETLVQRGASVDSLALYERSKPEYSPKELKQAISDFKPNVVVALSAETIQNLNTLLAGEFKALGNTPFVVSSERVAGLAKNLGYKKCFVPENLRPIDLIKKIAEIKRQQL